MSTANMQGKGQDKRAFTPTNSQVRKEINLAKRILPPTLCVVQSDWSGELYICRYAWTIEKGQTN
jgi:hypothetical protein